MADALKSWIMVLLTLLFVMLYTAALIGWLRPLSDITMITRLEPIIFVIIGYYFGRLPGQQNEKTLKDEILRQTNKADAAEQAKQQAEKENEIAGEKIKNTKSVLFPWLDDDPGNGDRGTPGEKGGKTAFMENGDAYHSIRAAGRILES